MVRVDLKQIATGGVQSNELHIFDSTDRESPDIVFGKLLVKAIYFTESETARVRHGRRSISRPGFAIILRPEKLTKFLRDEINYDGTLCNGWLVEKSGKEGLGNDDGAWLHTWTRSTGNGWTSEQVWGFEEVDGERRLSRRMIVAKCTEYSLVRMFHTFEQS